MINLNCELKGLQQRGESNMARRHNKSYFYPKLKGKRCEFPLPNDIQENEYQIDSLKFSEDEKNTLKR